MERKKKYVPVIVRLAVLEIAILAGFRGRSRISGLRRDDGLWKKRLKVNTVQVTAFLVIY